MFTNHVFDWSGTLSDDFGMCYEAGMKVLESFGVKRISKAEYVARFELPYVNYYRKLGVDAPKEELDKRFVTFMVGIKPKPIQGAAQALQQLALRGKKMAVLSAHPHEKLVAEACDYGFAGFFEKIVGSVRDKRIALPALVSELAWETAETVFVGDHVHEIDAGRAAGIATAVFPSKYSTRALLEAAKPTYLLKSIGELLELAGE